MSRFPNDENHITELVCNLEENFEIKIEDSNKIFILMDKKGIICVHMHICKVDLGWDRGFIRIEYSQ